MKVHLALGLLFAVTISALGSGCASVARGSSEKFTVQSTPSGAEVRLSSGETGTTPFEVEVKRKNTIVVTVTKPGYKPFTTSIIPSIDAASIRAGTLANMVTLPVINDVVDYNTGANYSHKPNPLIVTLVPVLAVQSSSAAPPPPVAATTNSTTSAAPVSTPASATSTPASPAVSSATPAPAIVADPQISLLDPARVKAGSTDSVLILGRNFDPGTLALFGTTGVVAKFVSPTRLEVQLTKEITGAPRKIKVLVRAAAGGISNLVDFEIAP